MSAKSAGFLPALLVSQSKGFSFARPTGGGDDIYIAQEDRKRAMLGDTVLKDIRNGAEASVGKWKRPYKRKPAFTGTAIRQGRDLELDLDGAFRYQVPVEKKGSLRAGNGDRVQAVLSYGARNGKAYRQDC